MAIVKFLKSIVTPASGVQLSKLDAHMLADIGFNTSNARATNIRMPAELGSRIV